MRNIYLVEDIDGDYITDDMDTVIWAMENGATDYRIKNSIEELLIYQDINGNYSPVTDASLQEFADAVKELAYPIEDDRDYIVGKLDIKVREEYSRYEDYKGLIEEYIEYITDGLY